MAKKEVSEDWARRLLRDADAETLRKISTKANFKTEFVFNLAMRRCDEIINDYPRHGLMAANSLCELSSGMGSDFVSQALGVRGTAFRSISKYKEARDSYTAALEIAKTSSIKGKILQRFGVLEMFEQSYPVAESMFNESLELVDTEVDRATSLVLRARVFSLMGDHERSALDAGLAIKSLDFRENERIYLSGIISIGNAIVGGLGNFDTLRSVSRLIQDIKRAARPRRPRQSMAWVYVDWVEAQVNGKLGSHRLALKQLEKVRVSLFEGGGEYFRDALLASIDIAIMYEESGEWELARAECRDTRKIALDLGLTIEAGVVEAYLSRKFLSGIERELRGFSPEAL